MCSADHGPMEARISSVEKDMSVLKTDVAVIRSNYVTQADLAKEVGAVRADVAKLETVILKWLIGTAITLTGVLSGVIIGAVRLIH